MWLTIGASTCEILLEKETLSEFKLFIRGLTFEPLLQILSLEFNKERIFKSFSVDFI